MPKTSSESRPFLIQLYFVLAALLGLVLIVVASVGLAELGLKELIGVKEYPEFTAPYPVRDPGLVEANSEQLTESQRESLAQWETDYKRWQQEQREFNQSDQRRRRQIASSLAMLLIGIPVFAIHAPYVFRRR